MKIRHLFSTWFAAMIVLMATSVDGHAQRLSDAGCEVERERFSALNEPLLDLDERPNESLDATMQRLNTGIAELSTYIEKTTLERLNAGADSKTTQNFLACMQSEAEYQPGDWSNTPFAIVDASLARPIAVTGMVVKSLGMDTNPLLACYVKQAGSWSHVGKVGNEYRNSTFDVYSLPSPVKNQLWVLVAGKAIGGDWSNVRAEVAVCDGEQIRIRWDKKGFYGGAIKVRGNKVTINYFKHNTTGELMGGTDGNAREFQDQYVVTAAGLVKSKSTSWNQTPEK
jgi:hypothetical protein